MRRSNSSAGLLGFVLSCVLGCSSDEGLKQRRELDEMERTLSALSSAPAEDREIRLNALVELRLEDAKIKNLRDLCADSYRTFNRAAMELAQAKRKTRDIEQAIAEALKREAEGKALLPEEKEALKTKSQAAQAALNSVNLSLDRAEKLIELCDNKRRAIRTELTSREP